MAAELTAAYKAATVGPAETQRVVVEFASGPQGRAAVERRVDCSGALRLCLACAVCDEAAGKVRALRGDNNDHGRASGSTAASMGARRQR